jgi:hypothetical protein
LCIEKHVLGELEAPGCMVKVFEACPF